MKTFFFIVFIVMMVYLISSFIKDTLNKGKRKNETNHSSLHSVIIPGIMAALVAQGLLPKDNAAELEHASLAEIEDYLLDEQIFDSSEHFQAWLSDQGIMDSGAKITDPYINMDYPWE